jgi:transcriptional regulator GlxA family with amidase domain
LLRNESVLLSVVARLMTDHFVRGHALDAGREHTAIARAKEWLADNSEQSVSISSLADVAGLSPY